MDILDKINSDWLIVFSSFIAVVISIYSLWSNRRFLDVDFEKGKIYFHNLITLDKTVDMSGIVCFIKIVNPTSHDIAFFDLVVIDRQSGTLLPTGYGFSIDPKNDNQKYFVESVDGMSHVNLPKSNYGIFKANSFTKLDVAFSPNENTTKVTIVFKVAIRSAIKSRFAIKRRKFKTYHQTYDLSLSNVKMHEHAKHQGSQSDYYQ